MSMIDDFVDEYMIQDTLGMFEKTEKELLNETLRKECLSMDEYEFELFTSKGIRSTL